MTLIKGYFLRLIVLLSILSITKSSFAQPANDDPCDATPLTLNPTCVFETFTNQNATATVGVPAPGCSNYSGGDVWFTIDVPCTGSLVIDTETGVMTDGGMAVYEGDCSNLTLLDCDDDGSSNGLMPRIALSGLTPGNTLYIRVWEYGNNNNGDFGVCVSMPLPPGSGGSCISAQPFCTSTQYTFPNTVDVPDAGGGGIYGCLLEIPNPIWYYMQVANNGPIEITISQTDANGFGIDVDYAIWGPFSDLQMSCPGLSAGNIVDCGYSTAATEVAYIPNAQIGEFYVMLITNYDNEPGTLTFEQTNSSPGSGGTTCNIICDVTASNTGPVCPGNTFDLSASPVVDATYSWTGPNCWTSSQQNPTGLTAPTMPGTYVYTVTALTPAGTNCTSSTTLVVGSISGTATTTPASCAGMSDGIIEITTSAPAAFTYTLMPGNISQPSPVFTGLAAGTYTVNYTAPTGCFGSVQNIIVANGTGPGGTATTTNTSCPGVSDGEINIVPTNPGAYTYVLTPGNISQTVPTFTGLAQGTYSVALTNTFNCTGNITNIIVSAGPAPVGTAVATPTSCLTVNDGTITVTPTGNGPYTYTLMPGNVVQTTPVFTGLATGTYTISFETVEGCIGTVPVNPVVTDGPELSSTYTITEPVCNNINDGSITINASGTAPFTYILTTAAGPVTQITPVFNGLAPGTYTYSFTDDIGCTGSGSVTLTTNPPIYSPVTLTMPLCNGESNGSITVTPTGGVSPYEFSLDAGVTYQSSGILTGLAMGSHNIRIRDNVGCIKDTTVMLAEPTALTITASSTPATCNGDDGTISITGGGGTAPYTYSVDGYNFQPSPDFTVRVGSYDNLTVKDANGCIIVTNISVALIDGMYLDLGPDITICAESSATMQVTTNPGTTIFNWSSPNTTLTTIDNPGTMNATVSPTDTAIYILTATWGECIREDQIQVNVLRKPVAHAGDDVVICNMDSTLISGTASNVSGGVYYVWSPAHLVREDSAAITMAIPDSTQLYTLTVTDDYGCNFSVTDSVLVSMQPPVPAFAGNDTIAILGVPHQLMGAGGTSYMWSPSANLDNPFGQNPMATLRNDTRFTVVVTDFAGCIGYDTVFVKTYEGPAYYVPNAFSPNGDGLNDVFRAIPVGIAKTDWLRVFNRYGEVVFETNQWLKGWDGTYKGKLQAMGVYIWVIKGTDRKGRTVEEKGTVMLMR